MPNTINNIRIAKNTLLLYFRTFLMVAISLFTSRIVLKILGVEDYGIYSVVGGVVIMFSFLNASMASATQRFLSVEIGRKKPLQLKKVFSISLSIHLLIAIVIIILAETIGLWFLNTQMNIPSNRMLAAQWVYQFSIFTFVISVIQVPYYASIIANEKMNFFAYMGILEVILKLIIVYMLVLFEFDKLILYSILICSVSLLILIIHIEYCKKKFDECKYNFYRDKPLFFSLLNFSGWSLFGTLAWVMMGQGLNILLNIFFGPTVNAARGIAFQVNATLSTFVYNLRKAVDPQIVKTCATGDKEYMNILIFESSKYSYFLLLFFSLPIILETNTILSAWLTIVPEYSIIFIQLMLINTLIQCCDIGIVFTAVGKIKANQFFGGVIYLFIVPISYYFLNNGYSPETVFYVQIVSSIFVIFGINLILLKKIIAINPSLYFKQLLFPIIKVTIVASLIPILFKINMKEGLERFIFVTSSSILSIFISVYYIGMNVSTKLKVKRFIVSKLNKNG